jgi:hypothetical protein
MVDYQYQPDMNDPVAKLRVAMDNMDGKVNHCLLHTLHNVFFLSRDTAYIRYSGRKSRLRHPFWRDCWDGNGCRCQH